MNTHCQRGPPGSVRTAVHPPIVGCVTFELRVPHVTGCLTAATTPLARCFTRENATLVGCSHHSGRFPSQRIDCCRCCYNNMSHRARSVKKLLVTKSKCKKKSVELNQRRSRMKISEGISLLFNFVNICHSEGVMWPFLVLHTQLHEQIRHVGFRCHSPQR